MILLGTKEYEVVKHQGYDPKGRALGQLDLPFLLIDGTGTGSRAHFIDSEDGYDTSFMEENSEAGSEGETIKLKSFLPKMS